VVPFICDVSVDEAMAWTGDRRSYLRELDERMKALVADSNYLLPGLRRGAWLG